VCGLNQTRCDFDLRNSNFFDFGQSRQCALVFDVTQRYHFASFKIETDIAAGFKSYEFFLQPCMSEVRLSLTYVAPDFNVSNRAVARISVWGIALPLPSLPSPPLLSPPYPFPSFPSLPLHGGPLPLYQLGGLGERCKLPQRGPGQSPGRQRIF